MNAAGKTIRSHTRRLASKLCEKLLYRGVVAERLADVNEAIDIAGAEDKTRAQLKGIFAEFVLAVSCGVGTFARDCVVATQQVKQVSALQFNGTVSGAVGVNEKRKGDAGLFTEYPRVTEIAHTDRC